MGSDSRAAALLVRPERTNQEYRSDDGCNHRHDYCHREHVAVDDSAGAADFGYDERDFASGQHP